MLFPQQLFGLEPEQSMYGYDVVGVSGSGWSVIELYSRSLERSRLLVEYNLCENRGISLQENQMAALSLKDHKL